jgi:diguanylate cyclase (GGDEF)-like protein
LPVAFEATVTYSLKKTYVLFVQDGEDAIFIAPKTDKQFVPGDRVLVEGTTQDSFRTYVDSTSITVLRPGNMPKAVPATFDDLIRARYDSQLVTVRGVIRAGDLTVTDPEKAMSIQLLTDGGYIDVLVNGEDQRSLDKLLDAEVDVTGVACGEFDGKMNLTGANIDVSSLADINVIHLATSDPWTLPVTPMGRIISTYHVRDLTTRERVHGTITYYEPGSAVVLQDGATSVWIDSNTRQPMQIGDVVDATGFPGALEGFLSLTHGQITDSHIQASVAPQNLTWEQRVVNEHILVSIEGEVITEVQEDSQDEFVLRTGGKLFSAFLRHGSGSNRPAMRQVALGSRVRITGICTLGGSNHYNQEVPFNLLMRSFDDIVVVAKPSMINIRNLSIVVGLLLMIVAIVIVRGWSLERKVHWQSIATTLLEQRRSRILEEINASTPLNEIVQHITEMVSLKLNTGYCWCEMADGPELGQAPPHKHKLRIISQGIVGRSDTPLGVIHAALHRRIMPSDEEHETLSLGARLTSLAVETRKLYTDLRHRSEFDLLTDIHNRFSLDKELDLRIAEAQKNAETIGLIYIDLDKFKPINDRYGHHVGDVYLQEVAERMKRQLRPHDTLARLGGDEFAALVAVVRSRADVEDIAHRLVRCFDDPFVIEGYTIEGAASLGIALYPDDADSKDSLLSAADTAMYTAKRVKKLREEREDIDMVTKA